MYVAVKRVWPRMCPQVSYGQRVHGASLNGGCTKHSGTSVAVRPAGVPATLRVYFTYTTLP